MSEKSLEQKVLADIEKAGFRSEMEVLARLRHAGWKATGLASYFDLDAEISREYDVEGYFTSLAKDGANTLLQFFYSLCIEVKKSEKPWVIFVEEPIHKFYLNEGLNSPCFFAGVEDSHKRVVVNPMAEHSLLRARLRSITSRPTLGQMREMKIMIPMCFSQNLWS